MRKMKHDKTKLQTCTTMVEPHFFWDESSKPHETAVIQIYTEKTVVQIEAYNKPQSWNPFGLIWV